MTETELKNLPNSTTGKRMLKRISPIYGNSIFMKMFVDAEGQEYQAIREYFESLRDQFHTPSVTWAIEAQERRYSVVPNNELTLEERRARLRIKLETKRPLNPAILEKYARDNYGIDVYLDEVSEPGYITLTIEDYSKAERFIKWLTVEKPAHLMIHVIVYKKVEFPTYIGIGRFVRGHITINRIDDVTIEPRKITDVLGSRTMVIEPHQVTITDGDEITIIPISGPLSDALALNLGFQTSAPRTITLPNPKPDLTAEEVNEVSAFAVDREIFVNTTGETTESVTEANLITITETELDLSLYFKGDDEHG